MKRSLIIVIVLLCLPVNMKSLSATNNSINNISKQEYFYNLRENFSDNKFGTCSYISLENLLSYFDTFYNDDIVPEKYEINTNNITTSPETYNDKNDLLNVSFQEARNYYLDKKEETLIGKLISIGVDKLNYGLSLTPLQTINILKLYLKSEVNMIEGVDYNINIYNGLNNNLCRSWIINEIQFGKIVVSNIAKVEYIGMNEYETSSHSTISYDYNQELDEIYMHYGYHSGDVNTYRAGMEIFDSSGELMIYNKYKTCFSVSFNTGHKHSDRYSLFLDDKKHISYCPCNYSIESYHNYDYFESDIGMCNECLHTSQITISNNIITDPDSGTLCGTHVNLYDKSYQGKTLNTGLTRILYFNNQALSQSRLDYEWRSDNSARAVVTKYGTVLGKLEGPVTIKAIYKNNPTKIEHITLNIIKDDMLKECLLNMTTDNREVFQENGTEVTELNNPKGLFTIHSTYTRVLCFKETNIYPSMKDFIWSSSNNAAATVSDYGTVFAKEVETETNVIITGICKYNSKVKARIEFTILPNN